jgi:hypothetical protein
MNDNDMKIIDNFKKAQHNARMLVKSMEEHYGTLLPGSPTLIDVLRDMKRRGLEEDRLDSTLNEYEMATTMLNMNPHLLGYLR